MRPLRRPGHALWMMWIVFAVALVSASALLAWRSEARRPKYLDVPVERLGFASLTGDFKSWEGRRVIVQGVVYPGASPGVRCYRIDKPSTSEFSRQPGLWVVPAGRDPLPEPWSAVTVSGRLQVNTDPGTGEKTLVLLADPVGTPVRSPWLRYGTRFVALVPLLLPLAVALLAIPRLVRQRRATRRRPPGTCPRCGYSLAGNVSGVCPECGIESPRAKVTAAAVADTEGVAR